MKCLDRGDTAGSATPGRAPSTLRCSGCSSSRCGGAATSQAVPPSTIALQAAEAAVWCVQRACAMEILHLCDDAPQGHGRIQHCLQVGARRSVTPPPPPRRLAHALLVAPSTM